MQTYSSILDAASRQPLPPIPDSRDTEAKKFEAAKDSADHNLEDNVPNGGPQFRGPIPGGAEPSGKGGPFNKATGVDSAAVICKGTFDIGPKGFEATVQCGATAHIDGTPGKGVGLGEKDGKPGVAAGDAHGGDVYTLDDASKKAGASSSASPGKSGVPEGLDWSKGTRIKGDDLKNLKRDIPPPPTPQINDLGPSTNEPEQKAEDAAVARNDQARFGDDIAQRI